MHVDGEWVKDLENPHKHDVNVQGFGDPNPRPSCCKATALTAAPQEAKLATLVQEKTWRHIEKQRRKSSMNTQKLPLAVTSNNQ